MKGTIARLLLFITLMLNSQVSYSINLEACDTLLCKEYFEAYTILTKRGHSDAMATLGELYYVGYGTEKDLDKAFKWFRRAAKFGNTTAQYKAGVMYLQQSDYQDIDKGLSLLEKSTKVSFSPSAFLLGKLYLQSHLIKQDLELADKWLSNAYQLNNVEAMKFAKALRLNPQSHNLALPTLFALVDDEAPVSKEYASPVGEMEVIIVTAPDYTAYFDDEIARLNRTRPDTESGTGSNIAGRTCSDLWACSSEGDGERIRDFMLSGWGGAI
ncbi:tetratricopeptide repeat protein [Shewanella colwelliana]|uniref:tetratricopeptide repeat protein n=2 Tax=Shewanella colwelliana TaxID=23 RepID=UPI00048DA750|nr:tetratricopeptide repeat protein [Shewanella colwelliana]